MNRTISLFVILATLCLPAVSCHPLKNTRISFTKPSYSSGHLGESIHLKAEQKFSYSKFMVSDGTGLPTRYECKGSYKIKRKKIFFYPDSIRLDNNLMLSTRVEKPKEKLPELSKKINGVFLVHPKKYKSRNKSITEWSKTPWKEITKEEKHYFFKENYSSFKDQYLVKQDSLWKLYIEEDLEFFERPQNRNQDWRVPDS